MDLCSFVDGPAYDALGEAQQALVASLISGKQTQAFWNCDSYYVFVYPPDHPAHAVTLAAMSYWSDFWGQTREDANGVKRPRGYVEVA